MGCVMKIDVSKIVKSDGSSMAVSVDIPVDEISFGGQVYRFTSPFQVSGMLKNADGNLYLDADVKTQFLTNCGRCLKELTEDFEFSVSEVFSNIVSDEDSLFLPIVSNMVDLKSAVEDNFCTSLPIRFLCSQDCKGLCHVCGKNLNDGACECENEEIDPRLAVLKSFLKND